MSTSAKVREADPVLRAAEPAIRESLIGEILTRTIELRAEQVDRILAHQKHTRQLFGEAAVDLGAASQNDVLFALAQQFHYPYSPLDKHRLDPELVVAVRPFTQQAEAFRAIRSQLLQRVFAAQEPRQALAVISADSGDGKTFFSANLAVVLSQLGGRTLLVDANLRAPRQHQLFGVENTLGLSGVLSGRAGHNVISPIRDLPSLFVLPGGSIPPNPVELVERPAFSMLLRELTDRFDHVVVDTPAAQHGVDASAIAAKCGAALCVARQGRTRVVGLQDLIATLSAGSTKLAGAIMNDY